MAEAVSVAAGADRIEAAFGSARERGESALMPYMMGGYPDRDTSAAIARAYVDSGADLIELGLPFSDPLADGPVIHAAGTAALAAGIRPDDVLGICSGVAERVPVVLMAYANLILGSGGAEAFGARAAGAGAAGVIVPDLPNGEDEGISAGLEAAGLAVIPMLAPTTTEQRRRRICGSARGFVYVVSTVGTTGERSSLPPELAGLVATAKRQASAPVAVGFGISTPQQVAEVGREADGVIVGTRLVKAAGDAGPSGAAEAVGTFLREARSAMAG